MVLYSTHSALALAPETDGIDAQRHCWEMSTYRQCVAIPLINAYLVEEQLYQTSPRSDLKWRSL